jgi:hypothetical protein
MPLQAERLPAADILLRYLCHFDAAKVDLSGPDPKLVSLSLILMSPLSIDGFLARWLDAFIFQ